MGCGPSTPEDQRNLVISRDLKRERSMEAQVVKILLLGAGESGKSTIVKQMKLLTAVDGRESVRIQREDHRSVDTSSFRRHIIVPYYTSSFRRHIIVP